MDDARVRRRRRQGPVIDALPRISAPLVSISPDYEPTDVDSLASHGIRTVTMSNVGHLLMLEDSEQFNRVLEDVIDGFARPGP
jgi:hypothetical protein